MDVLTVSVKTAQTFEATTIREKGYLYHNASLHKTFWLQKVLEARNRDQLNWFLKCLNYHRKHQGRFVRRRPPEGVGAASEHRPRRAGEV